MCQISVVVPVFNAELFLKPCLDSILGQTYSDFELILVDDGSTDNSGMICDVYSQRDQRVRVFHQKNSGQSKARNTGLRKSAAEWIVFVDSDDVLHPQMIEVLYDIVKKCNCKIAACGLYEASAIPEGFTEKRQKDIFSYIDTNEDGLIKIREYHSYCFWMVMGKIIHRSILGENPFSEGRIYEDNAVVPQWLYTAGKIAVTEGKYYFYRINPNGTTKQEFSIKKLDYLWALECQLAFFKSKEMHTLFELTAKDYMMALARFASRYSQNSIDKETYCVLKQKYSYFKKIEHYNFKLSNYESEAVLRIFHPVCYKLRMLSKTSLQVLKNDGILSFIKRTARFIRRRIT